MITGQTLIDMGYKPSKWFSEAILNINERNLNEKEIVEYVNTLLPPPTIEPFATPVPYILNIIADNKAEQENINKVIETMNILMKTPTVVGGCVMPDACPTGSPGQIPVGGVVVTKNAIHPPMHSADMCCSMYATNLGKVDPKLVLDLAFDITQFGPGKRKGYNGWSNLLVDNKQLYSAISNNFFTKDYVDKAEMHLGTQGDGNHFLFVGISEETGDTYVVTHHRKENKKDSYTSSPKILEIKLDIGTTIFLPFSLIHIGDVINESKRILNLADDWDHDGAIKINHETWQSSCQFLIDYAKYVLKNYGVIVRAPEINPCSNGSIDLVWRTKTARLLINIKQSGSIIFASYYGDLNENNQAIKNVIEKPILIEHLAFWMRNLA